MNQQIVILACVCSALVCALPVPDSNNNQQELDIVQIPIDSNKELDILSLNEEGRLSERNKRTIGILRDLFPELSKLNANGDNSIDLTALNQQLEETIRVARQVAATQENSVTSSETDNNNNNSNSNNDSNNNNNNNDQLQQASESKAPAIDELTLDIDDDADDRNKRFLNLGFGGTASGGTGGASVQAGGSVAGSGNFLFDIIRLFSGSIQTQGGGDDRANDASTSSEDTNAPVPGISGAAAAAVGGYTEGIPGPVTRLVVLANRGLANLIQDLILRIAATSERLVNFKARLITALI